MLYVCSKDSMHEVRIGHQLPMDKVDVVVLYAENHYSAAVKSDKVLVRGPDYVPCLKGGDTSDEENDDDYVSNLFRKGWSTCDESRHRSKQTLVCIPEEMYKCLVTPYRERIGIPLSNTTGCACPFCPQEFRSCKVLRHHYRIHHKYIVTGMWS